MLLASWCLALWIHDKMWYALAVIACLSTISSWVRRDRQLKLEIIHKLNTLIERLERPIDVRTLKDLQELKRQSDESQKKLDKSLSALFADPSVSTRKE